MTTGLARTVCPACWGSHGCELAEGHLGDHVCLVEEDDPPYLNIQDPPDRISLWSMCCYAGQARVFEVRPDPARIPEVLLCAPGLYFERSHETGCATWAGTRVEALDRLAGRYGPDRGGSMLATLDRYGLPMPWMAGCIGRLRGPPSLDAC